MPSNYFKGLINHVPFPLSKMAFCEKITIPAGEDFFRNMNPMEAPGFSVLVACIPETNQPVNATSEVQRAALNVLINCLCAPLQRVRTLLRLDSLGNVTLCLPPSKCNRGGLFVFYCCRLIFSFGRRVIYHSKGLRVHSEIDSVRLYHDL